MLSPFGKLCRKLRIDNNELLKDMADKLGVTPAYLSAIELGKRNIPKNWPQKICEAYELKGNALLDFEKAAKNSELKIKMDLSDLAENDKDLVLAFARKFTKLTDDDKEKIQSMLSRSKRDEECYD